MRAIWCWLSSSIGLALFVAGCQGGPPEPQSGSESHFLIDCDMSCESGFECLCGVCTQRCEAAAACQPLHASAECVAVDHRPAESRCAAQEGVTAFCDVRCESVDDCAGLGSEFVCRAGFCRQDSLVSQARDGRIDQDELCDFYVNDVCDVKMQCFDWDYQDREQCLAAQECDGWNDFQDLVSRGVVSFDPVATYQCHERLLETPCSLGLFLFVPELPEALKACGALHGLVAEGESCTGSECQDGLNCRLDSTCPGTCQRSEDLTLGEACLPEICLDGRERCEQCGLGLQCANEVCRPEWQLGDACSNAVDCKPQLWCNRSVGQCQPLAALGETCSDFEQDAPPCVNDLWCDGKSFATGVCQPRNSAGGACDNDGDCVEPYTCLPTADPLIHQCGEVQPDGSPCDSFDDCSSGLCDGEHCAPQPTAGDSCVGQCADGYSCGPDSTCLVKHYPGQACDDTAVCSNSRCESGVCTIRKRFDEACSVEDDCLSFDCVDGRCADVIGCN